MPSLTPWSRAWGPSAWRPSRGRCSGLRTSAARTPHTRAGLGQARQDRGRAGGLGQGQHIHHGMDKGSGGAVARLRMGARGSAGIAQLGSCSTGPPASCSAGQPHLLCSCCSAGLPAAPNKMNNALQPAAWMMRGAASSPTMAPPCSPAKASDTALERSSLRTVRAIMSTMLVGATASPSPTSALGGMSRRRLDQAGRRPVLHPIILNTITIPRPTSTQLGCHPAPPRPPSTLRTHCPAGDCWARTC